MPKLKIELSLEDDIADAEALTQALDGLSLQAGIDLSDYASYLENVGAALIGRADEVAEEAEAERNRG